MTTTFKGSRPYRHGDYYAICGECGFRFYASELQKRWDGAMVCAKDWEPRHPQDQIKVRPEKSAPPWTRPEQYLFVDRGYYADGVWTADGTITAIGSGSDDSLGTAIHRALAPADPDSL